MKRNLIQVLLLVCGWSLSSSAATIYVKYNASGSSNGTSWANAYTDLTSALAGASALDEIWVAAGTYKPTSGTSRTVSFELEDSVAVYGGFAGTENVKGQRDWITNVTILSGDIGTINSLTDNSYHVVTSDVSHLARLDGFTIEEGYANGGASGHINGGGVYLNGSDLTIRNCLFKNNHSFGHGAGLYVIPAGTRYISIENCDFRKNDAHGFFGGGFHVVQGNLSRVKNCSFIGNKAGSGAGFYISNLATLEDIEQCTMTANNATYGAGAYLYYGNVDVLNSVFKKNTGTYGGGIYSNEADLNITACRFDTNSTSRGGGIYTSLGSIGDIKNSHFLKNTGSAIYSKKITGTIDSCTFFENVSGTSPGGAIKVALGKYRINNSQFRFNGATSSYGGAIYQSGASVAIENCAFDSNYTTYANTYGGGAIYAGASSGFSSIRRIHNSTFKGNTSVHAGGAISATVHNITVSNSTFKGNRATNCSVGYGGGAFYLTGDTSTFTQCLFENNFANSTASATTAAPLKGGALLINGKYVTVSECRFLTNSLGDGYTSYRNGGAIALSGATNSIVRNSVFLGNSTGSGTYSKGGAIYTKDEDIKVLNCVFSGNRTTGAVGYGAACYVALPYFHHCSFANNSSYYDYSTVYMNGVSAGDTAKLINCVIWDNATTTSFGVPGAGFVAQNSIIQGGYTGGTNIIQASPFFQDANGADNTPGNMDDDLRLRSTSPAIDTGWAYLAPARDMTGFLRDLVPDIGAYEYGTQKTFPPLGTPTVIVVPPKDTTKDTTVVLPPNSQPKGFLLPDTLYACTPDTFFMPITSGDTIQHVIGWDFKVQYDTALLVPTGRITQIESNMIDTNYVTGYAFAPPGKDYVNVALVLNGSGPSGACWNGVGEVVAVEFVKLNALLDTTVQFRLSSVGVSYSDSIAFYEGDSTLVGMVQGTDVFSSKIAHWANDSLLKYDDLKPKKYNATQIIGTTRGGTPLGSSYNTDSAGQFNHSMTNGKYIRITRDIKGSTADSVSTDVMRVINGNDAVLTLKTMLEDTSGFLPTIHQMIAMDVNRDGVISSGDVSQINMRTVGKFPEFRQRESHRTNGTSRGQLAMDWIFIDSSTVRNVNGYQLSTNYPDPDAAGGCTKNQVPVPPIVIHLPVIGSGSCPKVLPENYLGILYGDIDGNWDADTAHMSSFKKSEGELLISLETATVSQHKDYCSYAIPISIASDRVVTSVDFDLRSLNPNIQLESIETIQGNTEMLLNKKGSRRVLLTSHHKQPIGNKGYKKGETLFMLHLKGTGNLNPEDLWVEKAIFNGNPVAPTITGLAECGIESKDDGNSVEDDRLTGEFSVYPNPTNGQLIITLPETEEAAICTLYDLQGREVLNRETTAGQKALELDLSDLQPGTYLLKATTPTESYFQKVTKE